MLYYTKRSREVYLKLKGKFAERELYDVFEFHRNPRENVTNIFSTQKLIELSGLHRNSVLPALRNLLEEGLIKRVDPIQRGKWRFELPYLPTDSIVVVHNNTGEQSNGKNGTNGEDTPPY